MVERLTHNPKIQSSKVNVHLAYVVGTVVKQLTHNPKFQGLKVNVNLAWGIGTVVKQLTVNPKFQSSNSAADGPGVGEGLATRENS